MLRHDVRTCGITARARGQIFFGNLQKKDLSTAYMLGSNFLEALDMDIFGAKSRAAAKRKNEATAAAIAMMKEIAAEGCHLNGPQFPRCPMGSCGSRLCENARIVL